MLQDFLKFDNAKVPSLCFHTANLCDDKIVMYGGLNMNDKICGDVYMIKLDSLKVNSASYDKNKDRPECNFIFN
jgi:hypothetical protein